MSGSLLPVVFRFIGELYRHFLITDTVIQWCCVHLIKNYEVPDG